VGLICHKSTPRSLPCGRQPHWSEIFKMLPIPEDAKMGSARGRRDIGPTYSHICIGLSVARAWLSCRIGSTGWWAEQTRVELQSRTHRVIGVFLVRGIFALEIIAGLPQRQSSPPCMPVVHRGSPRVANCVHT
jgi:hypothetical protein